MEKTKVMYIWILLITFIRHSFSYGSNILPLFENFKEEAGIFFSNLLSYDGLIENGDKINSSMEVWKETLSGKRWANSAECKNKKKGKFTFTNFDENDPIIKEHIKP